MDQVRLLKLANRVQGLGLGVEVRNGRFVLGGCRLHVQPGEMGEETSGDSRLLLDLLKRYKGLLLAEARLVEQALDEVTKPYTGGQVGEAT